MSFPGETDAVKLKHVETRLAEERSEKWRLERKIKELKRKIPPRPISAKKPGNKKK
jgi:hypothetical protein